jgi:L-ornithine N5-oxygenase
MSPTAPRDDVPVYDLVGVGFGPSNLALAVAVSERNASTSAEDSVTAVFLERQPRFGWHRGMLIEDATMQVSFLKDLVTLRNPTSTFSFLCYLQDKGRLIDFINHKSLFPLRVEFHDYLEWAAAKVDDLVSYGHEVVAVKPVSHAGIVEYFDVSVESADSVSCYRTRNLVLATGLRPVLPTGVTLSSRVWHNRDLLAKIGTLDGTNPSRFIVVGAGQSAAEVTAFLHEKFADAEVCGVFSRYGYSPADDSSFANRIFDPAAVDDFFQAPTHVKQMLLNYHGNTNYSVVDLDLIEELYRRVYREKVLGVERLRLLNVTRLTGATDTADGVTATIHSLVTGERTELTADVLVCATGYRPADPFDVLGDAGRFCRRDELGQVKVARDYRALTTPDVRGGIFLQGGTEHTHGITSSLLSNTAVRAGDILGSIIADRDAAASAPLYSSASA